MYAQSKEAAAHARKASSFQFQFPVFQRRGKKRDTVRFSLACESQKTKRTNVGGRSIGGDLSGAGSSKCVTERVIDGQLGERVVGRSREKIVGIVSKLLPISYRKSYCIYYRARERERERCCFSCAV